MKTCIECFGEYKRGLSYDEVKELLKLEFGKEWHPKWRSFKKFIGGQTVSMIGDVVIYYRCDIENFLRSKNDRFFD